MNWVSSITRSEVIHTTLRWLGTVASGILSSAAGMITGIMIARALGPEGRGELAHLMFWPGLIQAIATLGLPSAILAEAAHGNKNRKDLVSKVLMSTAIVSCLDVVLSTAFFMILMKFDERYLVSLVYTAIILPAHLLSQNLLSVTNGYGEIKTLNIYRIAPHVTILVCSIFLFLFGILNITTIMSTYVIGTWAVAIIRYAQDFDTNFTSSLPGSINLIRNGMFLHLAGIINIFRDQFDKFIAVTLLPFDQIGIYFVAVTLATAPITVTIGSLSSIIAPAIGTNETYPDKIECFCRYSRVSLLFGLVISCAFVFILPIIVHIILGENYESAISVSQILGISAVAACIRGVMNTGLIVLKDWRLQSSNEALAFIALAPAPLFAYYYGSMGLAMVTLFSALVSLIFCISQITKKFNIPVHMLIGSAQVFKNDFSPFISILRGSRIRNY